ncbi:hypothetical protein CRU92_04570 [Arcobacter sp. FW59]|nr:hypothetical protein CRU92_04570 [Arcobacter sp. FW59]
MNQNIKMTIVKIETQIDGVVLKGELEYWAKDYCVKLLEPFTGVSSHHLQYAVPVKYVLEKSENPTCIELELLESSKEILKSIYLDKKLNRTKKCTL